MADDVQKVDFVTINIFNLVVMDLKNAVTVTMASTLTFIKLLISKYHGDFVQIFVAVQQPMDLKDTFVCEIVILKQFVVHQVFNFFRLEYIGVFTILFQKLRGLSF